MQILESFAMSEKEAAELGADFLGVGTDKITARVYKKGSSGFLGLGTKTPSVYHIHAIKDITPLDAIIRGVLLSILSKMGYRAQVLKVEPTEDGKMYVELASQQAGFIIGKRGKTLEALQFMANLLIEKFTQSPPKLLLDIERYRERRANYLAELAVKTAEYVIRTGNSRLLDPLNPYERRLVHMALQEDNRVKTESEGNGVYKRVRIFRDKGFVPENTEEDNIGNIIPPEEKFQDGQDPDGSDDMGDFDFNSDDDRGNR